MNAAVVSFLLVCCLKIFNDAHPADNVHGLSDAKLCGSAKMRNHASCRLDCTASSLFTALSVTSTGRSWSWQDARRGSRLYVRWEFPQKSQVMREKGHNHRKAVKDRSSWSNCDIIQAVQTCMTDKDDSVTPGRSAAFCREWCDRRKTSFFHARWADCPCPRSLWCRKRLCRNSMFAAQRRCWALKGFDFTASKDESKKKERAHRWQQILWSFEPEAQMTSSSSSCHCEKSSRLAKITHTVTRNTHHTNHSWWFLMPEWLACSVVRRVR